MAEAAERLPREVFEEGLKNFVMPTFDLAIEHGRNGVIIVKRIIAPKVPKG